ncbi:hypothetical protein HNQ56_002112 [Anaerotaenia torta]|uniref:DUF5696 domain-containing protein n=1 Tax=Anaerotaenia torta TaxID=433293 RepID=UPI003D19A104
MKFNKQRPKKINRKSEAARKIKLTLIGAAALAVSVWLVYYYVRFMAYDEYKQYLSSYSYEEGEDFRAIAEGEASVKGMVLAAENEYLKLYANTETAEIAVYDKRNKETVYSNPLNADEDPIANETNKRYLKSQFLVDYFNKSRAAGIYDSYSMSVARGQVKAEGIENGIRFVYDLGDHSTATTGIVPAYLSPEKMEELQAALPEADAAALRRYYINSTASPGMLELNGVAKKNKKTLQKITGYLEAAGFTEEDYNELMREAGEEVPESISFLIPLEYRLAGDGLKVSIPTGEIKEYGGAKIYRIQMMKFFGAPGAGEEGYMVVPNGSGSIIYFNNGKTTAADYSQYVYEIDRLAGSATQVENTEKARLGLFGICRTSSGVLATIEDGASLAYITAGVSGKYSNYNYVYPTFLLRNYDLLSMFGSTGNEADLPIVVKDMYRVNLTVNYTFLTEEYKGYSGMANYYREGLLKKGVLSRKEETKDIPFYYDILGGVKETAHFLGTQYLGINAVTTFDQAEKISDDLAGRGITNQVMNYQGWFNGGYYHDVADKVKIIRKLGGKSGLEDLSAAVKENGGSFYADAAFQKVTYISKRYSKYNETSKYYGAGYFAYVSNVNPTTLRSMSHMGYPETGLLLLSPRFLSRYVGGFVSEVKGLDISGISLRDLGDELQSDHKRTWIVNREEALDVVKAQLEQLKGTGKELMISGGNDYSLAYTGHLINVPLGGNGYFLIDEDIPLYQMIIHGSIDYAGGLLNYYDDMDRRELVLKLIEYGASPHYVFTWESANEMKYTGLNRYYSTNYEIWKEQALDLYKEVNLALQKVTAANITDHEILENGLRRVTYSNGTVFYLNYSDEAVTVGELTIPANHYEMEER